jgi:hypothetical protein
MSTPSVPSPPSTPTPSNPLLQHCKDIFDPLFNVDRRGGEGSGLSVDDGEGMVSSVYSLEGMVRREILGIIARGGRGEISRYIDRLYDMCSS